MTKAENVESMTTTEPWAYDDYRSVVCKWVDADGDEIQMTVQRINDKPIEFAITDMGKCEGIYFSVPDQMAAAIRNKLGELLGMPKVADNVVQLNDGKMARLVPNGSLSRIVKPEGGFLCNHTDATPCEHTGHQTIILYEMQVILDEAAELT